MAGRGTAPRLRRASASKRRAQLDVRHAGGRTAMSRVYEALRKAQEQGATSVPMEQAQRPEPFVTQAIHGGRAGERSREFLAPGGAGGGPPASCHLRLDGVGEPGPKPGWEL